MYHVPFCPSINGNRGMTDFLLVCMTFVSSMVCPAIPGSSGRERGCRILSEEYPGRQNVMPYAGLQGVNSFWQSPQVGEIAGFAVKKYMASAGVGQASGGMKWSDTVPQVIG